MAEAKALSANDAPASNAAAEAAAAGGASSPINDALKDLKVIAVDGKEVSVPSLWQREGVDVTITLFVRHFLCLACRDAAVEMSAAYRKEYPEGDKPQRVRLICIGMGTPQFARSFRKTVDFAGDIYVDPSKTLYKKLGFVLNDNRTIKCCEVVEGFFNAFWQMIRRCWCICSAGDVMQNGGLIVVSHQGNLLFKHTQRVANDHANPKQVFKVANENIAK